MRRARFSTIMASHPPRRGRFGIAAAAVFVMLVLGAESAAPVAATARTVAEPMLPSGETVPVPKLGQVALVRVHKAERRLELVAKRSRVSPDRGQRVLASFPIALGDAPRGHKRREGDERTPEGRYSLDWRNPRSAFHRSIHVSYPNARDRAHAAVRGESPGGMIMIHGQPNLFGWLAPVLQMSDWTDGCIALTNAQMDVVWNNVPDGTPIEILP